MIICPDVAMTYQPLFEDIFEAAEKGTVQDIAYFLDHGEDVHATDKNGKTPLDDTESKNRLVIQKAISRNN